MRVRKSTNKKILALNTFMHKTNAMYNFSVKNKLSVVLLIQSVNKYLALENKS